MSNDIMNLWFVIQDTDIIVWDTVSQSGLYRLKGHKGLITQLIFMKTQNILISS